MSGSARGGTIEAGLCHRGCDVDLILETIGTPICIIVAAFRIVELVTESENGLIEVTDLRLEEDELLRLKH